MHCLMIVIIRVKKTKTVIRSRDGGAKTKNELNWIELILSKMEQVVQKVFLYTYFP